MLKNQAKKQGGFYVCAACRRQHDQHLAQLRSGGRAQRIVLSPASQPFSSSAQSIPKLPSLRRARNGTTRPHDHVLPRTAPRDARRYAAWGKFGSNMLPGQTRASWGANSTSSPSAERSSPESRGGKVDSKMPLTTGSSAWGGIGGASGPSPFPRTQTSGARGHGNNATLSSAPLISGFNRDPKQGTGPLRLSIDRLSVGTSRSVSQSASTKVSSQQPTPPAESSSAETKADAMNSDIAKPFPPTSFSKTGPLRSSPGQPGSATASQLPLAQSPTSAVSGSTSGITTSGPSPSIIGKGEAEPGRLNNPWGSGNFSRFGSPAGIIPGRPTFGGSVMAPARPSNDRSGIVPAKSTSGVDAVTIRQTSQPETASSAKTPPRNLSSPVQGPTVASDSPTRASASGGVRQSPDPLLDITLRKPPSRPAPAGAEFPQLRRRGSRDDLFESMSPFKLPLKNDSSPHSPGTSSSDPPRDDFYRPSPRRMPGQWNKRDRYPTWGDPSSLGSIAPPDPLGAISGPRSTFPLDPRREVREETRGSRKPVNSQLQLQREGQDSFSRAAPSPNRFRTPAIGSEPENQMRSLEQASTSQRRTSRSFDSFDQGSWDPPKSGERRSRETFPSDHGEINYGSRVEDNRRARGRGHSGDTHYDANLNHRGKAGKSKKRSGNRESNNYENETGEGFDFEEAMALREQRRRAKDAKRVAKEAMAPKTILLPEYIAVYDLAEALRVKPARFLQDLELLGFENILHDSVMTGETAALVAAEYGFEPIVNTGDEVDLKPRPPPEDQSAVPPRPPIVTIMGHVDHGKTTMLDFLRKSSVAAQEHGGITQHIGAFSVKLSAGKVITFLDTPGHAAFLSMRQRGANVTDIVVLVVAVDDSVKPQTIEAIKHAQNAKVPIIVAINKIDVDPSRIDHVKQDLATHGVEIEDFGGDVQVVAVSGKTGQGMNDLEETILTLSEILDVRAETDGMAEGWIIEASVKKNGKAATVLVKRGTLRVGDLIVAGQTYTRIRIMLNEAGAEVAEAGPGTPVEIYGGWKESPLAGDMVLQAPDETKAQAAVNYRQEIAQRALAATQKSEKELADRETAEREALKKLMEEADGDVEAEAVEVGPKLVNIIVKCDVMGSVEAVCGEIEQIGNNEVRPRILRSSPGQITESDVDLMATARGYIVNFNNTIPGFILRRAEDAGVKILDHNIIYEVMSDVKRVLSEQLSPNIHQKVLAEAEVLQLFPINITKRVFKTIAGVKIRTGAVTRGGLYRVMRDREKIHEGKLEALKQGKKDVTEMRKGTECGMMFENFDGFQTGDIIQLYENVEEQRHV